MAYCRARIINCSAPDLWYVSLIGRSLLVEDTEPSARTLKVKKNGLRVRVEDIQFERRDKVTIVHQTGEKLSSCSHAGTVGRFLTPSELPVPATVRPGTAISAFFHSGTVPCSELAVRLEVC